MKPSGTGRMNAARSATNAATITKTPPVEPKKKAAARKAKTKKRAASTKLVLLDNAILGTGAGEGREIGKAKISITVTGAIYVPVSVELLNSLGVWVEALTVERAGEYSITCTRANGIRAVVHGVNREAPDAKPEGVTVVAEW